MVVYGSWWMPCRKSQTTRSGATSEFPEETIRSAEIKYANRLASHPNPSAVCLRYEGTEETEEMETIVTAGT